MQEIKEELKKERNKQLTLQASALMGLLHNKKNTVVVLA